jgi:hypothetical protein
MNTLRRLVGSILLLALLPLTLALDSPQKLPEADSPDMPIVGAYTDLLTVRILKRYVREAKDTNAFVLEMTDYSTSLPINPKGDGWVIPNGMVFGSSMNRGMHAGTLIPFHGNWVVFWVVNGEVEKDCDLLLEFTEYDIPGMEIGFLPALGIFETRPTEAGKSMNWTSRFSNGYRDTLFNIGDEHSSIWSADNSYIYVQVKWSRIPHKSLANNPSAWEPPCKFTISMLADEDASQDRRKELQPFIGQW